MKRKIKKKKLNSELGLMTARAKHKNMEVSSSSLSSCDIQNRNSILFKEARKTLDSGPILSVKVKGGRSYVLKQFVEMQEEEIEDRESRESDELEDGECGIDDLDVSRVVSFV